MPGADRLNHVLSIGIANEAAKARVGAYQSQAAPVPISGLAISKAVIQQSVDDINDEVEEVEASQSVLTALFASGHSDVAATIVSVLDDCEGVLRLCEAGGANRSMSELCATSSFWELLCKMRDIELSNPGSTDARDARTDYIAACDAMPKSMLFDRFVSETQALIDQNDELIKKQPSLPSDYREAIAVAERAVKSAAVSNKWQHDHAKVQMMKARVQMYDQQIAELTPVLASMQATAGSPAVRRAYNDLFDMIENLQKGRDHMKRKVEYEEARLARLLG